MAYPVHASRCAHCLRNYAPCERTSTPSSASRRRADTRKALGSGELGIASTNIGRRQFTHSKQYARRQGPGALTFTLSAPVSQSGIKARKGVGHAAFTVRRQYASRHRKLELEWTSRRITHVHLVCHPCDSALSRPHVSRGGLTRVLRGQRTWAGNLGAASSWHAVLLRCMTQKISYIGRVRACALDFVDGCAVLTGKDDFGFCQQRSYRITGRKKIKP
jgi:hypothetical protein